MRRIILISGEHDIFDIKRYKKIYALLVTRLHVLFIVHNSGLSLIMFQGYKKQVNSASQLSLKNTGEQRGIKRSIRLRRAPLHDNTSSWGFWGII